MKYWPPSVLKTNETYSLPHPENECQWSVNDFWSCILVNLNIAWWPKFICEVMAAFSAKIVHNIIATPSWKPCHRSLNRFWSCILGNLVIALILRLITEPLTALWLKNTHQPWKYTDSKIMNIAIWKPCKMSLLDVENMILIRYYYGTAKTRVLYESTDGAAGQPADNPPNSVGFWDVHSTRPKLRIRVHWRQGLPILKGVSSNPDPDLKSRSGTVANTTYNKQFQISQPFPPGESGVLCS